MSSRSVFQEAERISLAAAALGFDWDNLESVLDKVREELSELEEAIAQRRGPGDPRVKHELGDLIQALSTLGRFAGTPAEAALEAANARFSTRFSLMGEIAGSRGQRLEDLDMVALDLLWEEAKRRLERPPPRE